MKKKNNKFRILIKKGNKCAYYLGYDSVYHIIKISPSEFALFVSKASAFCYAKTISKLFPDSEIFVLTYE